MKKEYDYWVNKRNTPNLDLYTKLIGMSYGTLGANFLMIYLFGKYVLKLEFVGLILFLSVIMFVLTPIAMTDPQKGNRDLFAVIADGVIHGVCTVGSAILMHFEELLIIYGIEILIVMFLIIRYFKRR